MIEDESMQVSSPPARREPHPIYKKHHGLHPLDVAMLRSAGIDPSSVLSEADLAKVRSARIPVMGEVETQESISLIETKAAVAAYDEAKRVQEGRLVPLTRPSGKQDMTARNEKELIMQELAKETEDLITQTKQLLQSLEGK